LGLAQAIEEGNKARPALSEGHRNRFHKKIQVSPRGGKVGNGEKKGNLIHHERGRALLHKLEEAKLVTNKGKQMVSKSGSKPKVHRGKRSSIWKREGTGKARGIYKGSGVSVEGKEE